MLAVVLILVAVAVGIWIGNDRLGPPFKILREQEAQFHFIDVGQGDAALIRTAEGNILVDAGTGASEDRLRAYLDNLGIKEIRYAIFSHPDEDHIGGADMILREYDVEQVILPPVKPSTEVFASMMKAAEASGSEILWATPSTTLILGGVTCSILAPLRTDYEGTNNGGIVLRVDYGNTSALFMGDAEQVVEEELVAHYGSAAGGLLDCDLVKVGHHGSDTSSGEAFLQAVTPDYGVISCGAGNPYGHPTPSVLDAYRTVGATLYRTDLKGSIVFTSTGEEPIAP